MLCKHKIAEAKLFALKWARSGPCPLHLNDGCTECNVGFKPCPKDCAYISGACTKCSEYWSGEQYCQLKYDMAMEELENPHL